MKYFAVQNCVLGKQPCLLGAPGSAGCVFVSPLPETATDWLCAERHKHDEN
jgi:hypothetical protein